MHNEAAEIRAGERPHKKTRRFGGKIFHLHGEEQMSKTGAEAVKQHLENRGYHVRVVKEPHHNEWLIYTRKVPKNRFGRVPGAMVDGMDVRRFGGVPFYAWGEYRLNAKGKTAAGHEATRMRNRGHKAHIVRHVTGYQIYCDSKAGAMGD